jgi:hypothetical protein
LCVVSLCLYDDKGNLFVSAKNIQTSVGSIYEFTPDGTSSTFASGLNEPRFLTFEPVPEPATLLPSEISKKFRGPSPGNPSDFSGLLGLGAGMLRRKL